MGSGHDHGIAGANERKLLFALGLTGSFMVMEIAGGLITNSLALLSDAAHMFTDVTALVIALAAMRIARRPADRKRTFGYHRLEILAATFNACLLFLVAIYIIYEAYRRFQSPPEVQSLGMLLIAVGGLVINFISMRMLRGGSTESLNMKGAYLEVWSDMVGSVGVIIAALLIWLTGKAWIDSLVAVAIGLWVLPRTWLLLKESLNILMEGVPKGVQMDDIEQAMLGTPGVIAVHDLHVWALTSGKNSLTAHLVFEKTIATEESILTAITDVLDRRFSITHTTIQVESAAAHAEHDDCSVSAANAHHDHENVHNVSPGARG